MTPTAVGDELAQRATPHLDALVEIAEAGGDTESPARTLHLTGPAEFTALRVLPALVTWSPRDWPCAAPSSRRLRTRSTGSRPGTTICPSPPHVRVAARWPGLAVLPRYLCQDALERGEVVILLGPPGPPLRTYFLAVRTGTLSLPHIARAHECLERTAVDW